MAIYDMYIYTSHQKSTAQQPPWPTSGANTQGARAHARTQKHGNIIPLQGDASSKPDLERVAAHVTRETGYINLLVANAGTPGPTPVAITQSTPLADVMRDLWATDPAAFDQAFSNNVRAAYFTVAAFLPLLDAGNRQGNAVQSSQAVITSSIGAYGRVPLAHFAYSASKAAVTHMAKQLATALTRYKIRVNVIAPGCEFIPPPSACGDERVWGV